jgi:hypothetical protein
MGYPQILPTQMHTFHWRKRNSEKAKRKIESSNFRRYNPPNGRCAIGQWSSCGGSALNRIYSWQVCYHGGESGARKRPPQSPHLGALTKILVDLCLPSWIWKRWQRQKKIREKRVLWLKEPGHPNWLPMGDLLRGASGTSRVRLVGYASKRRRLSLFRVFA